MKFELTDKDLNYIDKINEDIASGKNQLPLFISELNRTYYFEFIPVDLAKANAFVCTLMNNKPEFVNMLRDQCGIDVRQISYSDPKSTTDVIKILEETVQKLKMEVGMNV